MISIKRKILLCLLILFSALAAETRNIGNYRSYMKRQSPRHQTPLLRQLDYDTITATADDDDDVDDTDGGTNFETGTGTATRAANDADLDSDFTVNQTPAMVLIKPTQTAESGRLFKGLLIKALLGGGGGGSSGIGGISSGAGAGSIPYIIVNIPNNITNVNQNSLNNTASATTTTTTTTTTAAPATRQQVFYQSIPFPQNTEYFHRRGGNPIELAQNFVLSSGNHLIPIYLPPEVENLIQGNINRPGVVQRKRGSNEAQPSRFSAFANSFKRIQYL